MNDDLQNALKQLKRRAAGQRQAMPPTPREAQALLDERDALRKALWGTLKYVQWVRDNHGILTASQAELNARAILAKTRNEEA